MSFLDWVSMSILVDISCVVFFIAISWKLRKIENNLQLVKEDLEITMKNPKAARRRILKQRQ